ncbi:hypothetical protein DL96DRAFT_941239 [Flagelloscypha sp. PMI_526]|nr:hypothetical protein DL96DRAFT_941239 [Flagelloscypha sp. PMI_526]
MADVHEHSNSIYLDALADSFLLAWVLSQAWSYYTWFAQDTTAKKVNVAILVFLSVVQSFIEDFKLWFVLVRNGEWQKSSLLWSDLAVSGITNSIVGIWFILRCWKMVERNRWVLWTMCALWGLVVCANVVNIRSGLCLSPTRT